MNILRLNKKQSIFVLGLILVIVPIISYLVVFYLDMPILIPIISVLVAFFGSLIAKKSIK